MNAAKIIDLLSQRHAGDVFVPECKDGPTQVGPHLRMDAWAMPRSWSKPWVTAYEVKVSRSDFMQDNKWPAYLDCCHAFYFVCPHGLIAPAELPPEAGLLYATKNGARLYAKKKAPIRTDVEIPESVWRYVLMCRARIKGEYEQGGDADYWRRWLERKREDQILGQGVSRRIAMMVAEAKAEVMRSRAQVKTWELFRAKLAEVGIDPDSPASAWSVQRDVEELIGDRALQDLRTSIDAAQQKLSAVGHALDKATRQEGDVRAKRIQRGPAAVAESSG